MQSTITNVSQVLDSSSNQLRSARRHVEGTRDGLVSSRRAVENSWDVQIMLP
jgi:hypothetical protein